MPKRSFSIPDEVDTYIESIPKSQRSKFVSHALIEAMREQKKEELLQLIEDFDRGEPSDLSTVEMVRQLRDEETHHL